MQISNIRRIFLAELENDEILISFAKTKAVAGFPSPALNDQDDKINLFRLLIPHPSSTFLAEVEGFSMAGAGIHDGDITIIDRSLEVTNDKIVMAYLDGDFTLKRIKIDNGSKTVWLVPENDEFKPIKIDADQENFIIWGVATYNIKPL